MEPKHYITQLGYQKFCEELHNLVTKERTQYVELVSWAASNGDRSENADYQYGKNKLREIDKQLDFLTKYLKNVIVVDPKVHIGNPKIYFGAQVLLLKNQEKEQSLTLVGTLEINPRINHISWKSPLAQRLLGKSAGEVFDFTLNQETNEFEILQVNYAWEV